tara:strand:+ start:544 stop:783 length:240 start_codon:yes stop_codon:yes gene_type:complete
MSSLRDMEDTNFGSLGNSKHMHLVSWSGSQGSFIVRSMDEELSHEVVLDGDLPDDFVTQIENEIDTSNMELGEVDAGTF